MATSYNPKIVTDGLVLNLDAANRKSYSGSGANWVDLSKNNRNGTIVNAVWSSANAGIFTMNTSQYITIANTDFRTGTYTIIVASRLTGGANYRIVTGASNNYLLGTWSGRTDEYFSEGWVSPEYNVLADTNWRIHVGTVDTGADNYQLYSNGILVSSNNGGSQGPYGININTGYYAYNTEKSNCAISFILGYNRVLTQAEIVKNYNALKGRFGL
jgi:hypothetical protein